MPYRPTYRRRTSRNTVVIIALARAAATYTTGGYHVIVDGIIGPWFIERFRAAADLATEQIHYLILRPDEATTVHRAIHRGPDALTATEPVQAMYRQFTNLGPYERHVIDSTTLDSAATVERIQRALTERQFILVPNKQ